MSVIMSSKYMWIFIMYIVAYADDVCDIDSRSSDTLSSSHYSYSNKLYMEQTQTLWKLFV